MSDTLEMGEPHPAAKLALDYIRNLNQQNILIIQESFSSCSLSGNRLAEICSGTLKRLLNNEHVSDRYLLGLAWGIKELLDEEKTKI